MPPPSDRFPVLRGYSRLEERAPFPRDVPWALLAPHERRAILTHDQTLKRLAERGGLGLDEMAAILVDEDWWRYWRGLEKSPGRAAAIVCRIMRERGLV